MSIKERYNLLKILGGIVGYLLILGLYMQPVIASGCNSTFLGGPGDQSSFAWLYEASPNTPPLWGNTNWTNAPYGENVSEPFYISGLAQYSSVWVLEKAVGSTCAFNIYASFGFIFTATITYLFVLWILRKKSYFIPWFAGYLLAFSPYLQMKTPYHVSYVYAGLIILIIWLLMLFWKKPAIKYALALVVLGALMFYHDPYFIQLALFVVLAFGVGTVIYHLMYKKIDKKDLWARLKLLILLSPVFLLLISPVIYTRITQSENIETVVSESRDSDIMSEGRAYGARLWEFVLPSATNPFTPQKLKDLQLSHQHGATPTETTLFLGFIPLVLGGGFVWYWLRRGRNGTGKILVANRQLVPVAISLVVIAGLMALPPYINIGDFKIYFPSWLLLELTNMWRVPARFFVLVHIGLVILASLGLYVLVNRYKNKLKKITLISVYGIILLLSMVEFATFNPFDRQYWSQSMTPAVYDEIRDNNNVDRIAEYPLLDPPRNGVSLYYVTYQTHHHKAMINTAKAGSPNKKYRESLMNLYNWQVPGALKQLGVDRIVVHGKDANTALPPGFIKIGESFDTQTKEWVVAFAIDDSVVPKTYLLEASDGFDGPSNYGYEGVDYYMHTSGVLKPVLLPDATKQDSAMARIEFYAFEKNPRLVKIMQDGKVVAEVRPTENKQIVEFAIDPSKPVTIIPENATDDYSFVISNMEIR